MAPPREEKAMRKVLVIAIAMGLIGVAIPAFAEQSVNPVPGDLWGGARPAGATP